LAPWREVGAAQKKLLFANICLGTMFGLIGWLAPTFGVRRFDAALVCRGAANTPGRRITTVESRVFAMVIVVRFFAPRRTKSVSRRTHSKDRPSAHGLSIKSQITGGASFIEHLPMVA